MASPSGLALSRAADQSHSRRYSVEQGRTNPTVPDTPVARRRTLNSLVSQQH